MQDPDASSFSPPENQSPSRLQSTIRGILDRHARVVEFSTKSLQLFPSCKIRVEPSDNPAQFVQLESDLARVGVAAKLKLYEPPHSHVPTTPVPPGITPMPGTIVYDVIFAPLLLRKERLGDRSSRAMACPQGFTPSIPPGAGQRRALAIGFLFASICCLGLTYLMMPLFDNPIFPTLNGGNLTLSITQMLLAFLAFVVAREVAYAAACKAHKIPIPPPLLVPSIPPLTIGCSGSYYAGQMRTRVNDFDASLARVSVGLLVAVLLLLVGLPLSKQVTIEEYILTNGGIYEPEKLFNSYCLLVQWIMPQFFASPAPWISVTTGYGQNFWLPSQVIILHPIAFAGWLGCIMTWISLFPVQFFDGGHLFGHVLPTRLKSAVHFIGLIFSFFMMIGLRNGLCIPFLGALFAAMSNEDSTSSLADYALPLSPLPRSRRIVTVILVGVFVLLCPLSLKFAASWIEDPMFSCISF